MDPSDGLSFSATIESDHQDVTVVVLAGELDVFGVEHLRDVLDGACGGRRGVCVDLDEVPFLDTTALSALLRARRQLRDRGGTLVLCGAREPVARVIRQAGLDRVMPLFTTRDDALAHLDDRV